MHQNLKKFIFVSFCSISIMTRCSHEGSAAAVNYLQEVTCFYSNKVDAETRRRSYENRLWLEELAQERKEERNLLQLQEIEQRHLCIQPVKRCVGGCALVMPLVSNEVTCALFVALGISWCCEKVNLIELRDIPAETFVQYKHGQNPSAEFCDKLKGEIERRIKLSEQNKMI